MDWVARLNAKQLANLETLQEVVDDCERIDNPDRTDKVWVIGRNPKK